MKMMAFEEFEEISKLSGTPDKHRAWLKRYEGLNYSIALEGRHWMKWQTEPKEYRDGQFATNINCIGRRKDEVRIEFDGDEKKAKDDLEKTANRLKELGIGFIRSTHKGKSDYLWVQFDRNVSDKEAEAFLAWIAPIGSEVDLNFASSNKVFPVLFAIHWKHSYQRELPVEFFLGKKIVLEEFGIKPKGKIGSIKKTADGFSYKTFNKEAGMVFAPSGQASLFSSAQPLFYDKAENWWLWNFSEYRWQMVDEIDILNMIFEATGRDIISPKERTIILNSLKQEGRKNIPEDIKKSWIQFKDKFFDIMNGDEVEVTPKYFAVNPIPYALHKERFTQTPTMDRIFEEWVGKDYVPVRSSVTTGVLVKQHILERNKYPVPQVNTHTTTSFYGSGSTPNISWDTPFVFQNLEITGSPIQMYTISGSTGGTMPDLFGLTSSEFTGNNVVNITQSWDGINSTPLGLVPFTDSTQMEFYDGELSGSYIQVEDDISLYIITISTVSPLRILVSSIKTWPRNIRTLIKNKQHLMTVNNYRLRFRCIAL